MNQKANYQFKNLNKSIYNNYISFGILPQRCDRVNSLVRTTKENLGIDLQQAPRIGQKINIPHTIKNTNITIINKHIYRITSIHLESILEWVTTFREL